MKSAFVFVDPFWFYLVRRTDLKIRNIFCTHLRIIHLLRVSHLRSYRTNTHIEYRHTFRKMSFQINLTYSRLMFGNLPHMNLIRQILKCLNNHRTILKTDISNGVSCLFFFKLLMVLRPREVINPFPDLPR